jgi:hypothetical protein
LKLCRIIYAREVKEPGRKAVKRNQKRDDNISHTGQGEGSEDEECHVLDIF